MTSFINADSYSSPLVLLFGLATFAGCMGLGFLLLRLLRANLPTPFHEVVAVSLGIQLNSLAVQAAAMSQVATPALLTGLWGASLACGAVGLAFFRPIRRAPGFARDGSGRNSPYEPARGLPPVPGIAIAIAVVAGGANLAAALAPSTKIDELYYHMLLPSRIVADHGLRFYRMPIESAILPHMTYQIFCAPLHALGFPDAPNVVSWLLSLMLVWLGWMMLRQRNVSSAAAYCLVAAIPAGAYPIVFHVTGGGHAFGDLSLATAVAALATADAFLGASTPAAFALSVSLLAWGAASSKVSLLPLAFVVSALGGCLAWRAVKSGGSRSSVIVALAGPWLVLGTPLMLWTHIQSGSPFGPILAGAFGASLYDPQTFKDFARETRQNSLAPFGAALFDNLAGYSPLIWLGAIGALVSKAVPSPVRRWGGFLLLLQLVLIAWLLPCHARFLGGLHYGLALCFALYCPPEIAGWSLVLRPALATILALAGGLAPWIVGQVFYGQQFGRMVFGLEDRGAFYRRYVAFYDDFVRLDRVLPGNATLLVTDIHPPSAYFPRPVVFDPADAAPGREIYLFGTTQPRAFYLPAGCVADEEVYFNAGARRTVYRRPWVAPDIGELHVMRLARKGMVPLGRKERALGIIERR